MVRWPISCSCLGLAQLKGAAPHAVRAYGRAAEVIRETPIRVDELVITGRVRELRGVGRGIEERLRELVDTGRIAEVDQLEAELAPDLVGLGRQAGLQASRMLEIARVLGIETASEFRAVADKGVLRSVPASVR